jgi:hypothetical protein
MPNTTIAILSMLHEGASQANSAGRRFRDRSVLAWTLGRVGRSAKVGRVVILCWEDQAEAVRAVAGDTARVVARPRVVIPQMEAVSAALRWSDGWRGGLLATCGFDRGFHAPFVREAVGELGAEELAVLVDPAAGLVDPALIDALIEHAGGHSKYEFFFTQATPGLAGVAMRPSLLDRLAKTVTHPGRLLSYWPDLPGRDPITTDMCLAVPPTIVRTGQRLMLDSARRISRVTAATAGLNGQLIESGAEQLIGLMEAHAEPDAHPREVILELTTRRATRPIYSPAGHLELGRGDVTTETVERVLGELAGVDDVRLTLAGVGDSLLHPEFARIMELIERSGVPAVHVETDLLDVSDAAWSALAERRIDVLTVHLPAARAETYRQVMGVDGMAPALGNLKRLLTMRRRVSLVVPTFTKCRQNLAEMEPWYDHWLRVVGTAVIAGPSDYAGQIPDVACADMSPPRRRGCYRLSSRMTILSDGTIGSCEQDVRGRQEQGHVMTEGVARSWRERFPVLRAEHESQPLCTTCKEWHRP